MSPDEIESIITTVALCIAGLMFVWWALFSKW